MLFVFLYLIIYGWEHSLNDVLGRLRHPLEDLAVVDGKSAVPGRDANSQDDHPFTYSASHKDTAVGTKTHQTKGQISIGLMSIARVSWYFSYWCPLVVVSLQQFDHEGLFRTVSSEQLKLRCVCYLKHLFGRQS
jgi:hypothetical protein